MIDLFTEYEYYIFPGRGGRRKSIVLRKRVLRRLTDEHGGIDNFLFSSVHKTKFVYASLTVPARRLLFLVSPRVKNKHCNIVKLGFFSRQFFPADRTDEFFTRTQYE